MATSSFLFPQDLSMYFLKISRKALCWICHPFFKLLGCENLPQKKKPQDPKFQLFLQWVQKEGYCMIWLNFWTSLNPMTNAQLCVYLTVHITKLQLQTTFPKYSIYHIPHVFIGTLAAENFDVCTACDPWDSNSWYWYQNLGGAPPWGRACLS
jgi:hypothetical protein